ncbi:MAG: FecR domain-containing protein [Pseudomonadota bacterium]
MNVPRDRQDDIDTAATNWVARLGGDPLSAAERRALDAWLAQDPSHAAAFDEARAAWSKMGALGDTADAFDCALDSSATIQPASRAPRRHSRHAAAIAACLLIFIGAVGFWVGDPSIALTADHRTAPGILERVVLPDDSIVELGPDSAIAVRFTADERRVELLSGLAHFTAAPMRGNERRPFVVTAADGSARALGTQFMVRRGEAGATVTVIEHEVEVSATREAGRSEERVVVPPGKAVHYDDAGLGTVRAVNIDRAMAWRRGRLIVDHQPLAAVVSELNRYRRGRIVIVDPSLAAREVSGVFDMADPDGALAIIARDLRIRTASVPPLVTLLY